ncbi:hypothetical protein Tco_1100285 [Tanacetum coccineum]
MRIFRELLKLPIQGVNGSASLQVQGLARSSSSANLRLFVLDFQCPPLLVLLSDLRDDGDSLSLYFFTLRDQFLYLFVVPIEYVSPYDSSVPRERSSIWERSLTWEWPLWE